MRHHGCPLYRRLLVSSLQGRPFVGIGGSGKRLTSIQKSLYIEMTSLLILISGMDELVHPPHLGRSGLRTTDTTTAFFD
jgi:hypothetical protein